MGDRGIVDGAGARGLDFSSSVRVFFIPFPVAIESIRAFAGEDARGGRGGRVLTKCWQPVLYDVSIDVGYASPPLRWELEITGSGAVHGFGSGVVGSGLFLAGSEGAGGVAHLSVAP